MDRFTYKSKLCCPPFHSQIKNDETKTISDWNSLRKRLISAKMKECKETKKVRLASIFKNKEFHCILTLCCSVSDKTFIFVKKIGEGGYSSVYHVFDENRISYALKLVNLLKMDGYTDNDLMNEIELLKVGFFIFFCLNFNLN